MEQEVKIISKTLQENRIVLALQDSDNLVHSIFMPIEKDGVLSLGKTLILIVKDADKEPEKVKLSEPREVEDLDEEAKKQNDKAA